MQFSNYSVRLLLQVEKVTVNPCMKTQVTCFKVYQAQSVFLSFKGFRTLEDIRTKATLTHTLRIGLKHYDDFLDRMPRSEAAAIEKKVRE